MATTKFAQSLIKNESYKLNMLINATYKKDFEMKGISSVTDNSLKDKLINK